MVEFHGTCMYGDDRVQVSMQFVVMRTKKLFMFGLLLLMVKNSRSWFILCCCSKYLKVIQGRVKKGICSWKMIVVMDKKENCC